MELSLNSFLGQFCKKEKVKSALHQVVHTAKNFLCFKSIISHYCFKYYSTVDEILEHRKLSPQALNLPVLIYIPRSTETHNVRAMFRGAGKGRGVSSLSQCNTGTATLVSLSLYSRKKDGQKMP